MNIYYWCPFLSHVATIKAVLNSAISIKKYSKNSINPFIINAVGEWDEYKNDIFKEKIGLINFSNSNNLYKKLPRHSYIKSRISYLIIFFKTILKLYNFLNNLGKRDVFIIHLISSLPLFLILIFNFKCKIILRISGYPKLNLLRKFFWRLCKRKIYYVFCPTEDTKKNLLKEKIFQEESYKVLKDPILDVRNINKLKNEIMDLNFTDKEYIINIGRLTKQKNQKLLIECFIEIAKIYPKLNLVILGEGEMKDMLIKLAKERKIDQKVFFLGHVDNVYKYLKKSKLFILSSKWEDPGFVLIEAAFLRKQIVSSDCPNGPREILSNGKGGYLFKNNQLDDFIKKVNECLKDNETKIFYKKLNSLKNTREYTQFRHFVSLNKFLNQIC